MSRVYRILHRQGEWQILLPHSQVPIVSDNDRESLIRVACQIAKTHDGEVQVYDDGGNPHMTHTFINGVEKTTDMGRLSRRSSETSFAAA